MTIHLLVEGPSERAFLDRRARRLLKEQSVRVHPHEGKGSLPRDWSAPPPRDQRGLLHQLPAKLRGFASAANPDELHVVVMVDADNDDPDVLADKIAAVASQVAPKLRVTVRLAVEETEAFYLGDLQALEKAYPDADLAKARAYVPDSIPNGGTWELFGEIIRDGGGNKVAWAEAMGAVLTTRPARSRSPSFKALIGGLIAPGPDPAPEQRPRRYRHPTRDRRLAAGRGSRR